MFLTILEDSGKTTRLWCALTMQTRHVKLPVGETILSQFNSCDFKSLPLRLIILIGSKHLGETGVSWIQRVYRSATKEYQYLWFQRPFLPTRKKIAVSTKKNFKSKTSNNENEVEINYRKTQNKLNSKIRRNSKTSIASSKLRRQTLTRW